MAQDAEITENTQEQTQEVAETKPTTATPEKTHTQADVDRIVGERLARERAKFPGEDELKAFTEWKKSQQSEAEKIAEREKEYQTQIAKNTELQRELAVIKAGVKADDADYVIFRVSKMEGDFDKNLKAFLAENKKFTEPETKLVDGVKHTKEVTDDDTPTNRERRIMGLPPKKKE